MKNIGLLLTKMQEQLRFAEQQYGRPQGSVKLLAVSKTRPVEDIRAAYAAGQKDFAENYLQESIKKLDELKFPDICWHFIGPVQSNKTRVIAENFNWVHTVDREKIARRLNDARPDNLPPLNICLQVKIGDEHTKSGVVPDELNDLAEICVNLPRLRTRGLMVLPAPANDFDVQRTPFKQVKNLLIQLQSSHPRLDTLSMGTSRDYMAAIAEGATMIRIGTAIFGYRNR